MAGFQVSTEGRGPGARLSQQSEGMGGMISLLGTEGELTTFVGHGDLTPRELLKAYASFLERAPSQLVLWDLTGARLPRNASDVAIWGFAVMTGRLVSGRRVTGKTAIVCSCPGDLGVVHTLLTFLQIAGYPVPVKEFTDVRTARCWLAEEPSA
jgi:hypothetical protein